MKQIGPNQFIILVICSNINSLTIMKHQKLPRYDDTVSIKAVLYEKAKIHCKTSFLNDANQLNATLTHCNVSWDAKALFTVNF